MVRGRAAADGGRCPARRGGVTSTTIAADSCALLCWRGGDAYAVNRPCRLYAASIALSDIHRAYPTVSYRGGCARTPLPITHAIVCTACTVQGGVLELEKRSLTAGARARIGRASEVACEAVSAALPWAAATEQLTPRLAAGPARHDPLPWSGGGARPAAAWWRGAPTAPAIGRL